MLNIKKLETLKGTLEEQGEKYTHIIQMPCRIREDLREVITDFGKLTGETFNLEEMETDCIWCAVDWVDWIMQDINEN